ncbi:HIT family hydrolase [candidate division KSB1 bacterium 4572_119]|nr:MAG: HIT family hydrolase [candidate division KSB1 bacterium 4572_119]
MKHLWAPWRIKYIEKVKDGEEGCIFCDKPSAKDDRKNLILYRGKTCFVLMNLYPYNNAHLMVVPYNHISDISQLNEKERLELMELLALCKDVITESMKPHGFNIGMNLGEVAGAGVKDHLHFHIVPRWSGDTNFMPVFGKTKVISEGLEQTWEKLKKLFDREKEKM